MGMVWVDGGDESPDFVDVVDQDLAKRAMEIAATGGHGLLMVGPPGTGKTMLAKRLPTILPPLSGDDQFEALLVHSVSGLPTEGIAHGIRPFRSPHHSVSLAGLIGGGRPVLPGEVSLANKGVLFLDELPEMSRNALQALRQPLEEREVRIVRVDGVYVFPCDFLLVAAANPCPCGHCGDREHECTCTPAQIERYSSRIGGPLRDRIDLQIDVRRPSSESVVRGVKGASSEEMRSRVAAGQAFASERGAGVRDEDVLQTFGEEAKRALESVSRGLQFGGRAIVRCARVARTIADLEQSPVVLPENVLEACSFRMRGGDGN